MLLAAVLTLEPLDEAAHRATSRQFQRWFKTTIHEADPALFEALHAEHVARAYTLSPIYQAERGKPAWARIASVNDELSALLAERVLPDAVQAGEMVLDPRNDRARLAVHGLDLGPMPRLPITPEDADYYAPESWAGRVSYGELITSVMQEDPPRPLLSTLYLHTCTSFRINGPNGFKVNLPLPLPRYVFNSILRQWEALAPARLPVQVGDFFEYYMWVSYHRIRTVKAVFGGASHGKTVGFAGRVEFGMATRGKLPAGMRADWRHYVDVVRLLSAFAFYAGVGVRTSHGLGQTLPLSARR